MFCVHSRLFGVPGSPDSLSRTAVIISSSCLMTRLRRIRIFFSSGVILLLGSMRIIVIIWRFGGGRIFVVLIFWIFLGGMIRIFMIWLLGRSIFVIGIFGIFGGGSIIAVWILLMAVAAADLIVRRVGVTAAARPGVVSAILAVQHSATLQHWLFL